ncbi:MAG: hypothetical protein ACXWBO_13950 [Ilumatobacteraceae bacterium]
MTKGLAWPRSALTKKMQPKRSWTELKGLDSGSQDFEVLFREFSAKVHAHAASEESEVIPLLTSSILPEERQAMGDAFLASQHS